MQQLLLDKEMQKKINESNNTSEKTEANTQILMQ